jgi:hypothetical protein
MHYLPTRQGEEPFIFMTLEAGADISKEAKPEIHLPGLCVHIFMPSDSSSSLIAIIG